MSFSNFVGDERGISASVYKLALAVIVFAAVLAILVAVLGPILHGSNSAADTMEEGRKDAISNLMDET
ncbi:MAG: hypothetical protein A7316_00040 [Candidatus Altiarchaeales archaeon WOR_SM1_86-2]|nr:MAG: hypothetical protein A7316_00040 [Candidatus Altiarchaeales archaeon WOR_SM1_86-2]ODS40870.1 MAG: hypothetical protein A7315_07440 [Candidatus Altiarchaeales archaeon WOR_SM1_79]